MNDLTPQDAANLLLRALLMVRETFKSQTQLTVSSAAVLMTCLSNPGVKQSDIREYVPDISPGAVAKTLDMLQGLQAPNRDKRYLYRSENSTNRKENNVMLTEEGQRLAVELANLLNKQLRRRA